MKRPEKRKLEQGSIYLQYDKGYNHAHGDWEKFLPSEYDIRDLISNNIQCTFAEVEDLARAIHKRLEGK